MNKVWTKEEIAVKIVTDTTWMIRGITAIYNMQTNEEQAVGQTVELNGVGFNGCDSEIMSSFAIQIERGSGRYRFPLSPKQIAVGHKVMKKYAGQLARIANREI